MTLDERLGALVQTVEVMSHVVRDRDRTVSDHDETLARHHQMLTKHDEALTKLEKLIEPVITALPHLIALVMDHEIRIKEIGGETQ